MVPHPLQSICSFWWQLLGFLEAEQIGQSQVAVLSETRVQGLPRKKGPVHSSLPLGVGGWPYHQSQSDLLWRAAFTRPETLLWGISVSDGLCLDHNCQPESPPRDWKHLSYEIPDLQSQITKHGWKWDYMIETIKKWMESRHMTSRHWSQWPRTSDNCTQLLQVPSTPTHTWMFLARLTSSCYLPAISFRPDEFTLLL